MADLTKLQNAMRAAQFAYDSINTEFNAVRAQMEATDITSPAYKKIVERYNKLKPQYDAAKTKLDDATYAYKTNKALEDAAAVKRDSMRASGGDLDTAKKNYEKALTTNDPETIQKAKDALDAARAKYAADSASTSATTSSTTPTVYANEFADPAKYTLNANGTVSKVGGGQVYLVAVPGAKAGDVVVNTYESAAAARAAYVKAYASTPEQLAALKKQLVASGYATNAEMASDKWYVRLDDAITEYTTHTVQTAQFGGAKQAELPNEFFKIKYTGKGGSGAGGVQHTTRGTAKQAINAFARDFLGRDATPEEADAYYNDLIKAETAGGTSGVVSQEVTMIAANVLRKSLKGTNVDELLKNASGSAVATDIADLQQTAAKYGVTMTAGDALKYVAAGFGQKDYLAKQEERIRQTAIALHPQLKDHFLAGGTYKDIADQYKYAKQNKLGVVIDNALTDDDINDAIAKGRSLTDFKMDMQAKPEWRKSPEAHDAVNGFINNIAQMWGLG